MFERIKQLVVTPRVQRPPSFRDKAVLVVDLQYGYIGDMESLTTKNAELDATKRLLLWAKKANVEIIYLEYRDKGRAGTTIPTLFEEGEKPTIIDKWVPSGFEDGKLFQALNAIRVSDLIICGYNVNACVYETAKDARKFGFKLEMSQDTLFRGKGEKPGIFREAILADFYKNEVKMHPNVDLMIQSHRTK